MFLTVHLLMYSFCWSSVMLAGRTVGRPGMTDLMSSLPQRLLRFFLEGSSGSVGVCACACVRVRTHVYVHCNGWSFSTKTNQITHTQANVQHTSPLHTWKQCRCSSLGSFQMPLQLRVLAPSSSSSSTPSHSPNSPHTDPRHTDSGNTASRHTDSGHTDSGNTDSGHTDSRNTNSGHTDSRHTNRQGQQWLLCVS